MKKSPVPLVVQRRIQSSRDSLLSAFSSAEALSQWFTPDPENRVEVLDFDFVVGGCFRFRYTMADGRRPVVGGVYETLVKPSRIVMRWIWEAPDPLADIPMRVTFDFIGDTGVTDVIVTHEGIPSDQACTIHQNGWEGSLDRLECYLRVETVK